MAGMAPEHSGGRRPVDAELNLVPFIDLLCSLIAFLLMTAVWAQIASLEVKQSETSDAEPEPSESLALRIFVGERGFKIVGRDTDVDVPCNGATCVEHTIAQRSVEQNATAKAGVISHYDFAALAALLNDKRTAWPSEHEVYIDVADAVPYDDMIRTMDTCMAAGLNQIALGGSAQ